MKILITSGGTSEPIDPVRSITNHSSGELGKILAERFLSEGDDVTLVSTSLSIQPTDHPNLTTILIKNVSDLFETLKEIVASHQVLIHSMAVSDYKPIYMTGFEEISKNLDLKKIFETRHQNKERKISSKSDIQVLFLQKTPKIISLVKGWNPNIKLIGFKLLVNASKQEVLKAARDSLFENHADVIVANDLQNIGSGKHEAFIIEEDKELFVHTKEEIARTLVYKVHFSEMKQL